jgi:hypothetical protein
MIGMADPPRPSLRLLASLFSFSAGGIPAMLSGLVIEDLGNVDDVDLIADDTGN